MTDLLRNMEICDEKGLKKYITRKNILYTLKINNPRNEMKKFYYVRYYVDKSGVPFIFYGRKYRVLYKLLKKNILIYPKLEKEKILGISTYSDIYLHIFNTLSSLIFTLVIRRC